MIRFVFFEIQQPGRGVLRAQEAEKTTSFPPHSQQGSSGGSVDVLTDLYPELIGDTEVGSLFL
jgi:hypothetical protein